MKIKNKFLFFILFVSGCYTVPEIGRSAFTLIPEETLVSQSQLAFVQLKKDSNISYNSNYNNRLRRVGKRITEIASRDLGYLNWEYVVFEDDSQLNAFAMPGGKIGVYSGLIKFIASDDELAAVLGHEVAHVAARHSNQQVSLQMGLAAAGAIGGFLAKDMDETTKEIVYALSGVGGQLGSLRYSRAHEMEADNLGLTYMSLAGYNPQAAIAFWQKMIHHSKMRKVPTILSSHPAERDRLRHLQSILPNAMLIYQNNRYR